MKGGGGPHFPRVERGLDRVGEVLLAADRNLRDRQLLAVRRSNVGLRRAPAALAADLHRHVGPGIGELGQPRLETLPVRIAGGIGANWLIDGSWDLEVSVRGHITPLELEDLGGATTAIAGNTSSA